MSDPQITVNSNSTNAQLMGSLRDLLKVVGAGMVTHGFISGAYVEPLIGLLTALIPVLWSQWTIIHNSRKTVAVALADPKDVTIK